MSDNTEKMMSYIQDAEEVMQMLESDYELAIYIAELLMKLDNKVTSNTLWQYLTKEHLDIDNQLTEQEWIDFVDFYSDVFAEETAELGNKLFREYLLNYKRYLGSDVVETLGES